MEDATPTAPVSHPVVTKHIPALDGLRGAASLLVISCHVIASGLLPFRHGLNGELGVTVFFTLSGFLMAFLYAREPLTWRTAADYAISRFARIAPIYLLVVIACWFITSFIDPQFVFAITNQTILRHLLFAGSVGVLWSIPPEVQFYLFFFAIWFAVVKARGGAYLPAIAVLLLSGALHAFCGDMPGTLLPTKLSFFLFGNMAGLISAHMRPYLTWPKTAFIIQSVLLAMVAMYAQYICTTRYFTEIYSSLSYSALCAILIFVFSWPSYLSDKFFGCRMLVTAGKLSFVTYLIHVPCLYAACRLKTAGYVNNEAALIIGLLLTFGLAAILHTRVERPAQRYLKGLARPRRVPETVNL